MEPTTRGYSKEIAQKTIIDLRDPPKTGIKKTASRFLDLHPEQSRAGSNQKCANIVRIRITISNRQQNLRFLGRVRTGSDSSLSDAEKATLISPKLSREERKKIIRERQVEVMDGRVQISFELPMVRSGEGLILYDRLLLPGSGPSDIQNLGFGSKGFKHIVARLTSIKGLLDYFVVNIFVFAENHEKLNTKLSVLRFGAEKDLSEGLIRFVDALWLGHPPKPGLYFTDPLLQWVRRKLWRTGRLSKSIYREELGVITHAEVAEIKSHGKKFMMEIPERSEIQYFALKTPNYDYFKLPDDVADSESLLRWMGISKPFPFSKSKKSDNQSTSETSSAIDGRD